jgi:TetR/AcrR family transcriptional regulator, transcriptional repressor for nem operon
MPYPPQHKARTRARIVERARVMFNRHGFDQVSIDDIMREAGLTRGGFYHHFSSKEDLYAEAVRSFEACNPFALEMAGARRRPEPKAAARRLVELYLSDEVLNDVDQHCPLIALPSDVARAGLEPRAAYTHLVRSMLHVFRAAFPEPDRAGRAEIILNLCVGGMVIARTTHDPELRRSLRAAALAQALRLLGEAGEPARPPPAGLRRPRQRSSKRAES